MFSGEGERRAFLPDFVKALGKFDAEVWIEEGYGALMGFSREDYMRANPRVRVVSHSEAYQADMVIVLKAPSMEELDLMKPGSALISMLHYESRPVRVEKLIKNGIHSFSMDAVANDQLQRLVVTYEQTAWGGVSVALDEMEKRRADFYSEFRAPYNITIFGMGNLGVLAGRLCTKYFDEKFMERGVLGLVNGALVRYVGRNTAKSKNELRQILASTDLLVDATKRDVFHEYILTNDLIGCLKEEAIILDLTADPYNLLTTPLQGKAFEGLPYGTLEKYVFETDAPEYAAVPASVSTQFRRVTVSCNAWPGVFPEASMKIYGDQLLPFLGVLMLRGAEGISEESADFNERALYRGSMAYFLKTVAKAE